MIINLCFWALLSLENFEFIYLPRIPLNSSIATCQTLGNILLFKSLFDFIHPEERSLARTDLLNFIQNKSITGVVTRCRIRSIKSFIHQHFSFNKSKNEEDPTEDQQEWIVTDMIMYSANENIILSFFHCGGQDGIHSGTPAQLCGDTPINYNDMNIIIKALKLHYSPNDFTDSIRIFQIHDTLTNQILLSWPSFGDVLNIRPRQEVVDKTEGESGVFNTMDFDSLYLPYSYRNTSLLTENQLINTLSDLCNNCTMKEIERQNEPGHLKTSTCAYHSQASSITVLDSLGACEIIQTIISYGRLTFNASQITALEDTSQHPLSIRDRFLRESLSRPKFHLKDILNEERTSRRQQEYRIGSPNPMEQQIYNYDLSEMSRSRFQKRPGIESTDDSITSDEGSRIRAWTGRFGLHEKKCENCQTISSPEWRRGPSGHKT
ncbi:hypothetical protein BDB01DRAFT_811570 [Pilobolus umbonatus]|nr:hypothetical protein BDB01DRAFT_811570 [Pilobolus umbonatus]